ncbi:hypothetical protein LJY25_15655 [Hymenobacter sp. BT175]|uniref:hypothetical protein n=1 Tax=Hymenobacter translucens TaxID=2886507 RepID=UPI001D0E73E8|nr:hypothetical protein [Hymenobacter translucens]MCC2547885.1 hypothetical protein [Hymenobacter translucens]
MASFRTAAKTPLPPYMLNLLTAGMFLFSAGFQLLRNSYTHAGVWLALSLSFASMALSSRYKKTIFTYTTGIFLVLSLLLMGLQIKADYQAKQRRTPGASR